ncbi:MAG TPA: hypothetical protein VJ692_16700 [Nitrospiraceae bacterium]|nr:hypothetical protein [Nitrospiraceae bacterium]
MCGSLGVVTPWGSKRLGESGRQQLDALAIEADPLLLMGVADGSKNVVEAAPTPAQNQRDVAYMQQVPRLLTDKEVQ